MPHSPTLSRPSPARRGAAVAAAGLLAIGLVTLPASPAIAEDGPEQSIETDRSARPVAPGVTVESFDRWEDQGWLRADALTVDLTADVSIDYLSPGSVADTAPVREQAAANEEVVAAVNGDFFDINDTGAPEGAAMADGELVKSANTGTSNVVGIDADGLGDILRLHFDGTVTLPGGEHELAGLNIAEVPADGIAAFDSTWGTAGRDRVVDDAGTVAEVTVTDGVVTAAGDTLGKGPIADGSTVLVGRESGAAALAQLSVGDAVTVEYSPRVDDGQTPTTALAGRQLLVVDGEVQEFTDDARHPRTAVGFSADGTTMYLLTVDGRQAASDGYTLAETGELMAELGAHNALNLDGGGSSTMLARDVGTDELATENSPSDGGERSVGNGLAISVPAGSGDLDGFWVEPAGDTGPGAVTGPDTDRVFPGLHRPLTAAGHDETYAPVSADPRWRVWPSTLGKVDDDGVFTARNGSIISGATATVTASRRHASGSTEMTVLGELAGIEPTETVLGLADADATASLGVVGADAAGFTAPIDPIDVELDYDTDLLDIEPAADGGYLVSANAASGSDVVTATVGDHQTSVAVTVGLTDAAVADFTDAADWTFTSARATGEVTPTDGPDGAGLALHYDFTQSTATRAAYANPPALIDVPGQPQRFSMWIYGNGNGEWPSLHLVDAAGTDVVLRGDYITWTGWQQVSFEVPAGVDYPVRMRRFYVAETRPDAQYQGELAISDIVAHVPPSVEVPEAPQSPDPLVTGTVAGADWRFAVLNDSQFVGRDPDSDIVASTRRTLAEIKAADPEFLIINGDFVDECAPEDLALARQILDEELGDEVEWRYVPGNHEVMGCTIEDWSAQFGPTQQTFDHRGTRFITLDTSSLTVSGGGFGQIAELRQALDEAAADPNIDSVAVVAHVPTRDPQPQQASQLGDRVEVEVLEDWLTEFTVGTGKGSAYIGGHAGIFHADHVDGVSYSITGNSGKAPAGAVDDGGFVGWTEFGVDDTPWWEQLLRQRNPYVAGPHTWLSAQFRPQVDELNLAAPAELADGDTDTVTATFTQHGDREVPAAYPAGVAWSGSSAVYIGSHEPHGRFYRAWFDPESGTLTGLRPGRITLSLTVNDVTESATIDITR